MEEISVSKFIDGVNKVKVITLKSDFFTSHKNVGSHQGEFEPSSK